MIHPINAQPVCAPSTKPSSDTESLNRCNFVLEEDCSLSEEAKSESSINETATFDPIVLEILVKKFAHRTGEERIVSRARFKLNEATNTENDSQIEFKREHRVTFAGNDYSVLKQRLKSVFEQRQRIRAARASRRGQINLCELEAYNTARYGYNLPTKREYAKAQGYWFSVQPVVRPDERTMEAKTLTSRMRTDLYLDFHQARAY